MLSMYTKATLHWNVDSITRLVHAEICLTSFFIRKRYWWTRTSHEEKWTTGCLSILWRPGTTNSPSWSQLLKISSHLPSCLCNFLFVEWVQTELWDCIAFSVVHANLERSALVGSENNMQWRSVSSLFNSFQHEHATDFSFLELAGGRLALYCADWSGSVQASGNLNLCWAALFSPNWVSCMDSSLHKLTDF